MAWVKVPAEHHPIFMAALPRDRRVRTIRMFGGVAALINGHIFAGLFARSAIVRLAPEDHAAALALDGAELFDPMGNGRAMTDTVLLPESVMEDAAELRDWLSRALAFTQARPAKPAKPPRARAKTAKTAKPAATPPARFTGFSRSAMQFWHELAAEMSRDWFTANKQRYEDQWVAPMSRLLDDVARRIAPAYRPLKLGAPKVLRIHRDVRFAKDKTPYKTHIGAVITVAGKPVGEGGNAALYVHIGADEEFVGVGCYQFDAGKLARWRKAVSGKPGAELTRIVGKLRKAGYTVGGHDDYKKVPRGFDPDHPRAELLKLKGLTGSTPEIPAGLLGKPGFADWLVEHGKAMVPLVKWLHRHVG